MSTASLYDSHISSRGSGAAFGLIITILLAIGVIYAGSQLWGDLSTAPSSSAFVYFLLGIALLIALGFEMCNGFHDTSNAVATVIYTHSLTPTVAVVWSGAFNFLGVLTSTGAVAFGIISLLPVELILQVGSEATFIPNSSAVSTSSQNGLQLMKGLNTHADGIGKRRGIMRRNHELLKVDRVVGVPSAIQHIQAGNRKRLWTYAAQVAVKRQRTGVGRGTCDRHRNRQNSVRA